MALGRFELQFLGFGVEGLLVLWLGLGGPDLARLQLIEASGFRVLFLVLWHANIIRL